MKHGFKNLRVRFLLTPKLYGHVLSSFTTT